MNNLAALRVIPESTVLLKAYTAGGQRMYWYIVLIGGMVVALFLWAAIVIGEANSE